MRWRHPFILGAALAGLAASGPALAQLTLVPPDLPQGATYHLAFVTSTTSSALSTDIGDYDQFVQDAADPAGIGVGSPIGDITWHVIGSTPFDNARNNASVIAPVYRLDGVRVADGANDMWDGQLDVAIDVDEEGVTRGVLVHTGSTIDGLDAKVGTTPLTLGSSAVELGRSSEFDNEWIFLGSFGSQFTGRAFYGISEPLLVPGGVPADVPAASGGTLTLLVLSLCGSVLLLRRRLSPRQRA